MPTRLCWQFLRIGPRRCASAGPSEPTRFTETLWLG